MICPFSCPVRLSSLKLASLFAGLCVSLALLPGPPSTAQNPQKDRQLVQTGSANASPGKRVALVIGNGAYTNAPPLKNPPNDAGDMAATLKELDFEVTSGINASQREMKSLIRNFGLRLKAGGSGLFFYAGHGVQVKGRNYPDPGRRGHRARGRGGRRSLDVNQVLDNMDAANNRLEHRDSRRLPQQPLCAQLSFGEQWFSTSGCTYRNVDRICDRAWTRGIRRCPTERTLHVGVVKADARSRTQRD